MKKATQKSMEDVERQRKLSVMTRLTRTDAIVSRSHEFGSDRNDSGDTDANGHKMRLKREQKVVNIF